MVGKVREGYPADLTLKLRPDILEIIWQYLNLAEGWTIVYYHFFFPLGLITWRWGMIWLGPRISVREQGMLPGKRRECYSKVRRSCILEKITRLSALFQLWLFPDY